MKRALGAGLLLLLVVSAWIGVRGLLAQRHLVEAKASLAQAQTALRDQRIDDARSAVSASAVDTRAARGLTGDVIWRLAERVPYAGRSLRTAGGLASAADDVARGVLPAALTAAAELDATTLRRADGSINLELVRRIAGPLQRSADQAQAVRRRVAALPDTGTIPQVRKARSELLDQATELSDGTTSAAQAGRVAPALLGDTRLRRYFVLIQQPGESRGTGGLPGAYAILEARNGKLTVDEQGPIGDLPNQGLIAPPAGLPQDFVARYDAFGAFRFWVNSNLSPDLPVVARLINARWTGGGRPPLDGVITLDPSSLADLLRGGGPVDAGGRRQLTAEQVPEFLAAGQYEGLAVTADQSGRKERLQFIARSALKRFTQGGPDSRVQLAGLVDAVRSGHLRVASLDPALAQPLREAGIDGALPEGPAPVAYVVVNNFAAGKMESWLSRKVTYTAGACTGPRRRSRIVLTLQSDPPKVLPPYVTINVGSLGGSDRTSRIRTSLYVTRGAKLAAATLDGQSLRAGVVEPGRPVLSSGTEAGLPIWDLTVDLAPGRPRTLTLDLVEPTAPGAARVPEQPLVKDQISEVRVPAC